MSYGTDFTADIFLNRQSYENSAQVRDAIDECDDWINSYEKQLAMLAMANPKDITPEGDDVLTTIELRVDDIVNEVKQKAIKRYQLGLYLEFLEK